MKFLATLIAKFKTNRTRKPHSDDASDLPLVSNILNQVIKSFPEAERKDEIPSVVKNAIAQVILRQGKEASPESLKHARDLGLDVKDLLVQHKRFAAETQLSAHRHSCVENDSFEETSNPQPPDRSIDSRRQPATERPLRLTKRFPRPEQIRLLAEKQVDGRITVCAWSGTEEPAPQFPFRNKQLELLNFIYPTDEAPDLYWAHDLFDYRTAHAQFVHEQLVKKFGFPGEWTHAYSREAVFMQHYTEQPITDPRRTMISGPTGPAPLPTGKEWPVCPNCGEQTGFCQSLDMRDLNFSDLLPGTTMAIFICSECLCKGKMRESSVIVWLPTDAQIVLVDRGEPMPLLTASQWYGPDSIEFDDLPESMQNQIGALNPIVGRRLILGESRFPWMPPSLGGKSGGVPMFLNNPASFRDRLGFDMEYIGQIASPEVMPDGFGYIFHSTSTGETSIEFQFS